MLPAKLLKHHNDLIRAYYDMSSMMKNLFYMLLALLKEEGNHAITTYQINIKELEQLRGVTIRSDEIFKAAEALTSCTFTIYNPQQGHYMNINPIASAQYEKGTRKVTLEIEQKMLPFLFGLEANYSTYQLRNAIILDSKYSKRFYEMMSQYKDTGWLKISLEELKKRLGLISLTTGKDKFPRFALFKQYVLDVAQQELKEHTDISFTYEIHKNGNKHDTLTFKIYTLQSHKNKLTKKQGKYPNPDLIGDALLQYKMLTEELRWLDNRQAYRVVKTLPTQQIWPSISRIRDLVRSGKSIKPSTYFKNLLENYIQKGTHTPITQEISATAPSIEPYDKEKEKPGELVIRLLNKTNYNYPLISSLLKKIPHQEIEQALDKMEQEPDQAEQILSTLTSKLGSYPQENPLKDQSKKLQESALRTEATDKQLELTRKLISELKLTHLSALNIVSQLSLQEVNQALEGTNQKPDQTVQILNTLIQAIEK